VSILGGVFGGIRELAYIVWGENKCKKGFVSNDGFSLVPRSPDFTF
jgi:hypothetical protein